MTIEYLSAWFDSLCLKQRYLLATVFLSSPLLFDLLVTYNELYESLEKRLKQITKHSYFTLALKETRLYRVFYTLLLHKKRK